MQETTSLFLGWAPQMAPLSCIVPGSMAKESHRPLWNIERKQLFGVDTAPSCVLCIDIMRIMLALVNVVMLALVNVAYLFITWAL